MLQSHTPPHNTPWILGGDYNIISDSLEKLSSFPPNYKAMQEFNWFIQDMGLRDPGYQGSKYTWCNDHPNEKIWERLDRILINNADVNTLPEFKVVHEARIVSDHCPILWVKENNCPVKQKSLFKIQSMWFTHTGFRDIVEISWNKSCSEDPMFRLQTKLKRLKFEIKKWNWEIFGDIHQNVQQAKDRLKEAEEFFDTHSTKENDATLCKAQKELETRLMREELYWRDKARQDWLKAGDKNTSYFLSCVKERRTSKPFQLKDGNQLITDTDVIRKKVTEYYYHLFKSDYNCQETEIYSYINKEISKEDNDKLCEKPTKEEVHDTIMKMSFTSAPGPNSYTGQFYQQFWDIVGNDVYDAVVSFFNGESLSRACTSTHLTLIPKISDPKQLSDFRPLSLCNFEYKIFSRILLNRLTPILPRITS